MAISVRRCCYLGVLALAILLFLAFWRGMNHSRNKVETFDGVPLYITNSVDFLYAIHLSIATRILAYEGPCTGGILRGEDVDNQYIGPVSSHSGTVIWCYGVALQCAKKYSGQLTVFGTIGDPDTVYFVSFPRLRTHGINRIFCVSMDDSNSP